jgi:hypothetical protein
LPFAPLNGDVLDDPFTSPLAVSTKSRWVVPPFTLFCKGTSPHTEEDLGYVLWKGKTTVLFGETNPSDDVVFDRSKTTANKSGRDMVMGICVLIALPWFAFLWCDKKIPNASWTYSMVLGQIGKHQIF